MNPQSLNNEEIVQRITQLHGEYDPDSNLSALEQLEICETITEVLPHFNNTTLPQESMNNENDVNWNNNGTYKRKVYFELNESKHKVIEDLKKCNYNTDRHTIALLLRELFPSPDTKEEHWLFIAQHWNPRAINRVINQMVKTQKQGIRNIYNPAAYFTKLIQFRKRRRDM